MKWVKEHFFMSFIFSANYKAQTLKTHKKKPNTSFTKKREKIEEKILTLFFQIF